MGQCQNLVPSVNKILTSFPAKRSATRSGYDMLTLSHTAMEDNVKIDRFSRCIACVKWSMSIQIVGKRTTNTNVPLLFYTYRVLF